MFWPQPLPHAFSWKRGAPPFRCWLSMQLSRGVPLCWTHPVRVTVFLFDSTGFWSAKRQNADMNGLPGPFLRTRCWVFYLIKVLIFNFLWLWQSQERCPFPAHVLVATVGSGRIGLADFCGGNQITLHSKINPYETNYRYTNRNPLPDRFATAQCSFHWPPFPERGHHHRWCKRRMMLPGLAGREQAVCL